MSHGAGDHGSRRGSGEPLTFVSGSLPMAVKVAELVAAMISKERTDAFLTKVSGSISPRSRADGRICQFKPAFPTIVSIVPVTSLQVANYHLATRFVVGVVRECFKSQDSPTNVILVGNPAIVRSELGEVSDERLDEIVLAVDDMDTPFRN